MMRATRSAYSATTPPSSWRNRRFRRRRSSGRRAGAPPASRGSRSAPATTDAQVEKRPSRARIAQRQILVDQRQDALDRRRRAARPTTTAPSRRRSTGGPLASGRRADDGVASTSRPSSRSRSSPSRPAKFSRRNSTLLDRPRTGRGPAAAARSSPSAMSSRCAAPTSSAPRSAAAARSGRRSRRNRAGTRTAQQRVVRSAATPAGAARRAQRREPRRRCARIGSDHGDQWPPTRTTISRAGPTRPSMSRPRAATIVSPSGNAQGLAISRQSWVVLVASTNRSRRTRRPERVQANCDAGRAVGMPAPSSTRQPRSLMASTDRLVVGEPERDGGRYAADDRRLGVADDRRCRRPGGARR